MRSGDVGAGAGETRLGYRGPQVCSIVGITYRQLDYWARTGLLEPSVSRARGSGSQRLYSYSDLLQLKVIKRLVDAGVSLHSTRKAIECLRGAGGDVGSANLVIDGATSVLAWSGQEIVDLLKGGQTVLNIVPLGGVVSELEAAVTGLTDRAARATGPGAAGPGLPGLPGLPGDEDIRGAAAV